MSDSGDWSPRNRRERSQNSDTWQPEIEGQDDVRQTRRLDPQDPAAAGQQPLNSDWRRQANRRNRSRRRPLPSSPQDIQIWLQKGGWRYVAAVAALFIIALIGILALNQNVQEASTPEENPFMAGSQPTSAPTSLLPPTVTSAATTPSPTTSQFFVVTGTGVQGLFLRPDHSTQNSPIATLPEGTRVEQIGDDVPGEQYVWRKIRTPEGQEGWVAADFLRPVQ